MTESVGHSSSLTPVHAAWAAFTNVPTQVPYATRATMKKVVARAQREVAQQQRRRAFSRADADGTPDAAARAVHKRGVTARGAAKEYKVSLMPRKEPEESSGDQ